MWHKLSMIKFANLTFHHSWNFHGAMFYIKLMVLVFKIILLQFCAPSYVAFNLQMGRNSTLNAIY